MSILLFNILTQIMMHVPWFDVRRVINNVVVASVGGNMSGRLTLTVNVILAVESWLVSRMRTHTTKNAALTLHT